MVSKYVENKIKSAPKKPGVYRYFDQEGKALYVGKAKDLSKRLSNYLRPDVEPRIAKMLSIAANLDWLECENESKAFLTEALQIRDMQPRYNILLKDDKSFLELCFSKDEEYGRIFARRIGRQLSAKNSSNDAKKSEATKDKTMAYDKTVTFGPFLSGSRVKQVVDLIQRVFLVRDCRNTVFFTCKKQNRPCLQYHIKRCSGPCAGLISKKDYAASVANAISFCMGDSSSTIREIKAKMIEAADKMDYELAKKYRDQVQAITEMYVNAESKKAGGGNVDYIVVILRDGLICFFVRLVRGYADVGNIDLFDSFDGANFDDDMAQMVIRFYQNKRPPSKVIIANSVEADVCKIIARALKEKAGDKVVVQSGASNEAEELGIKETKIKADYAVKNKLLNRFNGQEGGGGSVYDEMKEMFDLPRAPKRIDVFDNSHLFGTNAVGGMIVATPDGFEKKEYRSYGFVGLDINRSDDYGMMRNVIQRRLSGLKEALEAGDSGLGKVGKSGHSGKDGKGGHSAWVPDLLIIDGGLGHLRAAKEAMEEAGLYVPVISMAKGLERNAGKERYFTFDEKEVEVEIGSPLALYLQSIRDEAHRFAITLHRKKRDKNIGSSELDNIEGVGRSRKVALLMHFGSVEGIKRAKLEDIMLVDGINKKVAGQIYNHFNSPV